MKLALLGIDDESLALAHWATTQGGHELTAAYDVGSRAADVRKLAPQVPISENWEALLLGSVADVVIVGRDGAGLTSQTGIPDDERRADQFRKLTQAAVPMIVVCPACEAIVGFEIDMIRRETHAVIFPYVPHKYHPGILRLAEMVRLPGYSPIGDIEQVVFEREEQERSRPAVLTRLARDIRLLRVLIGETQSVSASGVLSEVGRDPLGPKPKELPSLANLSLHLSAAMGVPARWSIGPAHAHGQGRIALTGQSGRAVLSMPDHDDWTLEIIGAEPTVKTYPSEDEAKAVWLGFSLALDGSSDFGEQTAWLEACRDQEAAEAVDRSLARGRTIELFQHEHTEEASFKGVMAMGGCLLLLLAIAAMLLATLVEALQIPVRNWSVWRQWPILLLTPIAVFLLLQLFSLALRRSPRASATTADNHRSEGPVRPNLPVS